MAEHGRLIDADALIKNIETDRDASDMPRMWYQGIEYAINHIIHATTIEPDQEKPAKWIIHEVANCDGEPPIAWECPECGEVVNCKYKFCPECGKPMEV